MNLNQALIVLGEKTLQLRLAEDRIAELEHEIEEMQKTVTDTSPHEQGQLFVTQLPRIHPDREAG